ncbi:agmatine deiminase family protein [Novipirellula artificiosorum]|uniref:Agmatine deiminase n=1 Tax=Novipirellula artificiosorum TaxID=2528016 RepID=A0A5C6E1U6_9BACT|nr:agmatine deiminase family protein [Novipirellula artificiosorum]TWU42695.1 Agmatine deiminase [Novipirellula artificiosorum]
MLAAGYTAVLLAEANHNYAQSQLDLSQSQTDLGEADLFLSMSLDELDSLQREFLTKTARRIQPSDDYSLVRNDLKQLLLRWLHNRRNQNHFPIQQATANFRLGQLHGLEGNNREAVRCLTQAVSIASQNDDKRLAAFAKNTLASVLTLIDADKQALDLLLENASFYRESPEQIALALTMRNLGVLQQRMGEGGISELRESVKILKKETSSGPLSITHELMIDTLTLLAEGLYLQRNFDEAKAVCEESRRQLDRMLTDAENYNVSDDTASSTIRYRNAMEYVDHNLLAIEAQNADVWRWIPLIDMATEMIQPEPDLKIKAVAEFDSQSAVVLAWGSYQWAHETVLEIARATHQRWRIDLLTDNDESLEEAIEAFRIAKIPTERIRFGVCEFEVPWFRDFGPIVAKSAAGNSVWFDSHQVRFDNFQRSVNDSLPRLLSTRWNARMIKTPLHIEGGAMLSNGQGFTICSTSLIEDNLGYGFDLAAIQSGLKYVTGATAIMPVEPLMGELTGHIDLFMTFTDPTTLVLSDLRDDSDPNGQMLNALATQISSLEANGHPLKLARVPMPAIKDGLARSYTNVIFANGVLLVPSYQGVAPAIEQEVKSVYEALLPDWEIKFIDCTQLATKGGSLHCLASNLGPTPYLPLGQFRQVNRSAIDP